MTASKPSKIYCSTTGLDSKDVQRRSFEMRKSLVGLRRVLLPMREVVNALLRRDLHIVTDPMQPYYQDVYDHVLRATEWTESLRDLVTTILETHLTVQGNRLNEIMKKLTAYAAIIAVPTAVTGFYGQNVPYPGFGHHWGFLHLSGNHAHHRHHPVRHLQAQPLALNSTRPLKHAVATGAPDTADAPRSAKARGEARL